VHKKRVAIIDEHEVFRRGVVASLTEDPAVAIVCDSDGGRPPPEADVVVTSPVGFSDLDPWCPSVVCWGPSDPPLASSVGRRVAIVERDLVRCEELTAMVRALAAGMRLDPAGNSRIYVGELDRRCRHILQSLSEGADTRAIASALCYSERTVKGLIRDIEDRLRARNRAEAVAKGIRLGLI
jgi:DNA-binding CsgD family transcriptional regulator